jgi:voltage-gated potassium channel
VGFREVKDLSPAGKIFTIALIFSGISAVAYATSRIGQDMIALASRNRRWRMEKQIRKMTDHFIVCGYGRMGRVIADELRRSHVDFVVVDHGEPMIDALHDEGMNAIEGDATSEEVLIRAGIRHARGLVTVLSKDADNVFVVLTARELNPGLFVLARANNADAVSKLLRAGASKVINPYESAGARMAHTLVRPVVADFMEVFSADSGVSISVEAIVVQAGSALVNCSLRDADVRKRTNAIIVAIKRAEGDKMVFSPSGDEILRCGDVMIAFAETGALNNLADMAKSGSR